MPRAPKDMRDWTFEVIEVERDPNDHFDLEEWLADLLFKHYKEQEAKPKSVAIPEEDPDSDFELKSD